MAMVLKGVASRLGFLYTSFQDVETGMMNKVISVFLAALAVLFLGALIQPQWNPLTAIILFALIAVCAIFSFRFWNKDKSRATESD